MALLSFSEIIGFISKYYKRMAIKYHPDKNFGDKAAADKFNKISEAYAVVTDPEVKHQPAGSHHDP